MDARHGGHAEQRSSDHTTIGIPGYCQPLTNAYSTHHIAFSSADWGNSKASQ